jgi:hypothetical protein
MTPSLWKYTELLLAHAQALAGLHYKDLERMDLSVSLDQVQRALAQTTLPATSGTSKPSMNAPAGPATPTRSFAILCSARE